MAKKEAKAAVERFEYGEKQELLRQSAKKFLAEHFSTEKVRKLLEEEKAHSESTWRQMADLGWHGILIPEDFGGAELSIFELGVLLEEMGWNVATGPYLHAQLAVLVLLEAASAKQKKTLFPPIAEGKTIPTLALWEKDQGWDATAGGVKAKKAGKKGFVLSGTKLFVGDAQNADLLIVTTSTPKGPSLFLVDARAKGVKVTPDKLVDETRRSARVDLKNVAVSADALLGTEGKAAGILAKVYPRIWSAISAEMVGAARRVFRVSVDYAKVREQFGRPIGAFQGVKHRLVDRMVELENARSLVYGALWAQDHEPARAERVARMAKAYLSDVGPRVGDTAVRTHGGIGFTWECDVHLFWKRLRWGQSQYGDAAYHRAFIGDELAAG